MNTLSKNILDICEETHKSLAIGDIIDTSSVNFDPVKAIGRIRNYKEDGQFVVEYPDGEIGILVDPKETITILDDSMYKGYIEAARNAVEDSPDLDIANIIHRVNHWIRKKKKNIDTERPPSPGSSDMNQAEKLLQQLEGFADVVPTTVHRKGGIGELWLPISQYDLGKLTDKEGNPVPTNMPLAINVSGISGSFVEVGAIENEQIVNTYTISIKDLIDKGAFLSLTKSSRGH